MNKLIQHIKKMAPELKINNSERGKIRMMKRLCTQESINFINLKGFERKTNLIFEKK